MGVLIGTFSYYYTLVLWSPVWAHTFMPLVDCLHYLAYLSDLHPQILNQVIGSRRQPRPSSIKTSVFSEQTAVEPATQRTLDMFHTGQEYRNTVSNIHNT